VSLLQIASGDLLNTPLLKYVAEMKKPMFVSTGGGDIRDVRRAYNCCKNQSADMFNAMHCSYPTEPSEMNLNVLTTYREAFSCVIGISDHYNGISDGTIAYVLGARVIEKHFTLNHAAKEPTCVFFRADWTKEDGAGLASAKEAMGDGFKKPYKSEQKPLYKMGKKLVASHDLRLETC